MDDKQLDAMRKETTVNSSALFCYEKINFVSRLMEVVVWAMGKIKCGRFISINIGNDVISLQLPDITREGHKKLADLIASEQIEEPLCRGFYGYMKNGLAVIKALEHEVLIYHVGDWEDEIHNKIYSYLSVEQSEESKANIGQGSDERINYVSSIMEIAIWVKEKIGCHFLSVDIGDHAISLKLPGNGFGSHKKIADLLTWEETKKREPICRGFYKYVKNGKAEVKALEHEVLVYHIGEWNKIDLGAIKGE